MTKSNMIVTKDGQPVTGILTPRAAYLWLLHNQSQSVSYALAHGGYAVETVIPRKVSVTHEPHAGPPRFASVGGLSLLLRTETGLGVGISFTTEEAALIRDALTEALEEDR